VTSDATNGCRIGTKPFETGTKMLFQQTAAPVGWTKGTTHDNKALRVVTGTASSGGSTAFTSVFAARTITEDNLPAHTHSFSATTSSDGAHTHFTFDDVDAGGSGAEGVTTDKQVASRMTSGNPASGYLMKSASGAATHGLTSSNGAHTHTISGATGNGGFANSAMDFAVAYVDLIIATAD
jgi:hypothetical protein